MSGFNVRYRIFVALLAAGFLIGCSSLPSDPVPPVQSPSALSANDQKLFEEMFKLGLFDPAGCRRVSGKVEVRTCWSQTHIGFAPGWLKGDRIILDNLRDAKAPTEHTPIDLAAEARHALDAPPGENGEMPGPNFGDDDEIVPFAPTLRYVFWAAWLYRRGRFDLAHELLTRVRRVIEKFHPTDVELLEAVAKELAAQEYNQALYALRVGADDEAELHTRRFERMQGAEEFADGKSLIAEIKRRKAEGTLGRPRRDPKRLSIQELIQELDQVQSAYEVEISLCDDPCIRALISKGDSAIPELLDCFENDTRYTRCIEFGRSFVAEKSMVEVRYGAKVAIHGILGISEFEEVPYRKIPKDGMGNYERAQVAALRAYWAKYGGLKYDERMMGMLKDRNTPKVALRQAAQNLAFIHRELQVNQPSWNPRSSTERKESHPAIGKFSDPTAAELILATYDRDPEGERGYLRSLVELNDPRIASELLRRSRSAKTGVSRAIYAECAFRLGRKDALHELAADLKADLIKDPKEEFVRIVTILVDAADPLCDEGLQALTVPTHAQHPVIHGLLADPYGRDWWDHPFCFKILRRVLDDDGLTTWTWVIDGDEMIRLTPGSISIEEHVEIPPLLKNPADRQAKCLGRRLDHGMKLIQEHLWGFPAYHPLRRDADRLVAEAKRLLDVFDGRLRRLNPAEVKALGPNAEDWSVRIPDVEPLGRPATAKDVAEGRAIFHLDGRGKTRPLDRQGAYLKGTRMPVVILQSEESPSGEVIYGVVGEGLMGPKGSHELSWKVMEVK